MFHVPLNDYNGNCIYGDISSVEMALKRLDHLFDLVMLKQSFSYFHILPGSGAMAKNFRLYNVHLEYLKNIWLTKI